MKTRTLKEVFEQEDTMNQITEAASILGALGGKSTSPAKQAASRENGKRGGRPTATHTVTMKPQLYDVKTRDGKLVKRSMTARDALRLARRINGQREKQCPLPYAPPGFYSCGSLGI